MKIYCIDHNRLEDVSQKAWNEYETNFVKEFPTLKLHPYRCMKYKKPKRKMVQVMMVTSESD